MPWRISHVFPARGIQFSQSYIATMSPAGGAKIDKAENDSITGEIS